MSGGFADPVAGGGGSLVRPSIHSPGYVAGSTGWTINKDGSVEFNNGTFRGVVSGGSFVGTQFIVNPAGTFFYSGAPAAGNLIASLAPVSGTDTFGNPYVSGFGTYSSGAGTFSQQVGGNLILGNLAGSTPDTADAGVVQGLGTIVVVATPVNSSGAIRDALRMTLASGATGQPTNQATTPYVSILANDLASAADVYLSGNVIKTDNAANQYKWQAPAYNTNWLTSTTFNASSGNQALRYRLGAEDTMVIEGAFKAGAIAPGAVVYNAAAPYRTAAGYWVTGYRNRGGVISSAGFQVTSGNFNVVAQMGGGAPAANDEYWIPRQEVSLGNVS